MEHKLIQGGEQYLPFARSRIKALRAAGLRYATQRFSVDGVEIAVRLVGDQEYIDIRGGDQTTFCVLPTSVAYPFTVLETAGVEAALTPVAGAKGMRKGTHSLITGAVVWATSPRSPLNIVARTSGTTGAKSAAVFVDEASVLTGTGYSTSVDSDPSTSENITADGLNHWCSTGICAADAAVAIFGSVRSYSVRVAGPVVMQNITGAGGGPFPVFLNSTTTYAHTRTIKLLYADYLLDANGAKTVRPNGSYVLTYREVAIPVEVFNATIPSSASWGDLSAGVYMSKTSTGGGSGETTFDAQSYIACSADGIVHFSTTKTVTPPSAGSSYEATLPVVGHVIDTNVTNFSQIVINVTRVSRSGAVQQNCYEVSNTWSLNVVETNPPGGPDITTTVNTYAGLIMTSRGIIVGKNKIAVAYTTRPANTSTETDYLDIVNITGGDTKVYTKEKTINLGTRTTSRNSGFRKLRGASIWVGDYIWTTQYCFCVSQESFTELPEFINGAGLTYDVTGEGNAIHTPNIDANYYSIPKDGSAATYYWLNLSAANQSTINASGTLTYPLTDGLAKRFIATKDSAGVVSVALDPDFPTVAITGTSLSASSDINGATLRA